MQLRQPKSNVIVPKLKDAAEKEKAREKLERDIEVFFQNDGYITEIPIGKSNLIFGSPKKRYAEHSEAGKKGAILKNKMAGNKVAE